MARPAAPGLVLWALLFLRSAAAADAEGEGTCVAGQPGCPTARAPYWPYKNRDTNRSGFSPHVAPFDLSKPVWTFREPDRHLKKGAPMQVFHGSPLLDGELNTYIASTTGWIYSVDRAGRLRWSTELSGGSPGNPALVDGVLYTGSDDGVAWAISSADGSIIWKRKAAMCFPADTYSAMAVGGLLLLPMTPLYYHLEAHNADSRTPCCGSEVMLALRTSDGQQAWRYNVTIRSGVIMYNVMPSVVGGSLIFDDYSGGIYRLSLKDGLEEYYRPGPSPGAWSTGGMLVGPNGRVYVARNEKTTMACNGGGGFVRAHDFATGEVLWHRSFNLSNNVGMAVGQLSPGGPLAIVAALGPNLSPAPLLRWDPMGVLWKALRWLIGATSRLIALDAGSGKTLWSLELGLPFPATAGVEKNDLCAPDIFGNPSIGADGTVYISWTGGKVFAVKDVNGDGRIDADNPREVSSYHHGYGANGNPALAPGYMVAPSCNVLAAFAA